MLAATRSGARKLTSDVDHHSPLPLAGEVVAPATGEGGKLQFQVSSKAMASPQASPLPLVGEVDAPASGEGAFKKWIELHKRPRLRQVFLCSSNGCKNHSRHASGLIDSGRICLSALAEPVAHKRRHITTTGETSRRSGPSTDRTNLAFPSNLL